MSLSMKRDRLEGWGDQPRRIVTLIGGCRVVGWEHPGSPGIGFRTCPAGHWLEDTNYVGCRGSRRFVVNREYPGPFEHPDVRGAEYILSADGRWAMLQGMVWTEACDPPPEITL